MTHVQKQDFVFRRNGRVHLNQRGRLFSRLLAAEVCASAVIMLDTPCSEVVWRVLATHSIRQFPPHFPSLRHRVPSHFNWSLQLKGRLCRRTVTAHGQSPLLILCHCSVTIVATLIILLLATLVLQSSWNVMAHGDGRKGKWRGNWRMEWVASTLHTTSEHGVSSITTADSHTSAAISRLNWRPCRLKWTRPFRRKTKSVFCDCTITFQTQSNVI